MELTDILGTITVFFYGIVLLPQIHEGYMKKSMAGLSFYTFSFWTFGDILNVLSAYLLNQILAVKATAILFVVIDVLTLWMYFYYEQWQRPSDRVYRIKVSLCKCLGVLVATPVVHAQPIPHDWNGQEWLGSLFAWLCAVAYFGSRFPQIWLLLQQDREAPVYEPLGDVVVEEETSQSSTGYLVWVFMICANVSYAASLMLVEFQKPFDLGHFFIKTFPYMLGSVGTIPLDVFILILGRTNRE